MAKISRSELLGLYRSILRLHRSHLPAEMRDLGDSHVKSEFRAHLIGKNTTEQHLQEFVTQWRGYVGLLAPLARNGPVGLQAGDTMANEQAIAPQDPAVHNLQHLAEGLHQFMSPEQQLRMQALKKEAAQLGRSMLNSTPAEQVAADAPSSGAKPAQ